ncbi:LSU ribosomal protein L31p [hydrothermal vent metagenome]|uniref:Large ribosomal subunit protein bL31 n=1 Tax=hydrothermal vent metagenome TaxID=652676 RepID=A0A1W1CW16_9ZZZZ
MKAEIHPNYKLVKVHCTCGNTFETKSTTAKDDLNLEVCSNCHPFYTGKQKMLDSGGRIEKFKNRYATFKR